PDSCCSRAVAEDTSTANHDRSGRLQITQRTQIRKQSAMTSYRQIEANRRNALRSTGPRTQAGKRLSRRNALRHGLTAETIIGSLEDAEDYSAFEAAIIADYDAQSAVEHELVLRLGSLLLRLRRATIMETKFGIQLDQLRDCRKHCQLPPKSRDIIHAVFRTDDITPAHNPLNIIATKQNAGTEVASPIEFARCFLRLANLPNFALDRLIDQFNRT